MTKQSQKQLNLAIKGLIDRLQKTEKFVLSELPDLCQQIVKEKAMVEKMDAISSGISALVFLILTILCGLHAYNAPSAEGVPSDSQILSTLLAITFFVVTASGFDCMISSIKNLLSIKIAPKLYILEKLKKLI